MFVRRRNSCAASQREDCFNKEATGENTASGKIPIYRTMSATRNFSSEFRRNLNYTVERKTSLSREQQVEGRKLRFGSSWQFAPDYPELSPLTRLAETAILRPRGPRTVLRTVRPRRIITPIIASHAVTQP